jgi:hypothetical protein
MVEGAKERWLNGCYQRGQSSKMPMELEEDEEQG